MGLIHRLPLCMHYAMQSNIVPQAFLSNLLCLSSLQKCSTALWRKDADDSSVWGVVRLATNSPNNLWDKALTFLPFSARCLALLQQLLSPQSQGTWDGCCCQIRLAQKFLRDHWSSSERSLEGDSPLHRPLPAKYPHKSMNIVHVGVCVKTFRYAHTHINI